MEWGAHFCTVGYNLFRKNATGSYEFSTEAWLGFCLPSECNSTDVVERATFIARHALVQIFI